MSVFFAPNLYKEAVNKADIIVLLVAHKEFKDLQFPEHKILIDFAGVTT